MCYLYVQTFPMSLLVTTSKAQIFGAGAKKCTHGIHPIYTHITATTMQKHNISLPDMWLTNAVSIYHCTGSFFIIINSYNMIIHMIMPLHFMCGVANIPTLYFVFHSKGNNHRHNDNELYCECKIR